MKALVAVVLVALSAPVASAAEVSVPGAGVAGTPIAVSVADTGDARVDWTFGDGGTASGSAAEHTYAAAGYYAVTAVVDRGAGVSESVRRVLRIDPRPATLERLRLRCRRRPAAPCDAQVRVRVSAPTRIEIAVRRRGSSRATYRGTRDLGDGAGTIALPLGVGRYLVIVTPVVAGLAEAPRTLPLRVR